MGETCENLWTRHEKYTQIAQSFTTDSWKIVTNILGGATLSAKTLIEKKQSRDSA